MARCGPIVKPPTNAARAKSYFAQIKTNCRRCERSEAIQVEVLARNRSGSTMSQQLFKTLRSSGKPVDMWTRPIGPASALSGRVDKSWITHKDALPTT